MLRKMLAWVGMVVLCAGCPKETPEKPPEPKKLRAECDAPSTKCYRDCISRKTSSLCPSCCFENLILCDEGNRYDFERCKKED